MVSDLLYEPTGFEKKTIMRKQSPTRFIPNLKASHPNVVGILRKFAFTIFSLIITSQFAMAQQTKMSDYAIFGGFPGCVGCTNPPAPGYGVVLGAGTTVNGNGKLGSYTLVNSTGSVVINGDVNSGGKVQTVTGFTLNGNLNAANTGNLTGNIISMGTSTVLKASGNINANGSILIGQSGSLVSGKVSKPSAASYSGPAPAGGFGTSPQFPGLPTLPPVASFPAVGTQDITNTQTITPGSYGKMKLNGGATVYI
jgi:hypothetical protein